MLVGELKVEGDIRALDAEGSWVFAGYTAVVPGRTSVDVGLIRAWNLADPGKEYNLRVRRRGSARGARAPPQLLRGGCRLVVALTLRRRPRADVFGRGARGGRRRASSVLLLPGPLLCLHAPLHVPPSRHRRPARTTRTSTW